MPPSGWRFSAGPLVTCAQQSVHPTNPSPHGQVHWRAMTHKPVDVLGKRWIGSRHAFRRGGVSFRSARGSAGFGGLRGGVGRKRDGGGTTCCSQCSDCAGSRSSSARANADLPRRISARRIPVGASRWLSTHRVSASRWLSAGRVPVGTSRRISARRVSASPWLPTARLRFP